MKYSFLLVFVLLSCSNNEKKEVLKKDSIEITKADSVRYVKMLDKTSQYGVFSQERQRYLDSALIIKPDNAALWRQKAMPLYKMRKYNLGKPFLEKAVLYNPESYLDYSAFMKCIFSKEYEESIEEFKKCKKDYGDSYVMDHTYNFYIALNYLQLNKFKEAKAFLLKSKAQQLADFPKDSPEEGFHFLDWFYLGIADYELGNYQEAINSFNTALKVYSVFADAMYYKALCYSKLNKNEKAKSLFNEAYKNKLNSIVEDNSLYEVYPYQVFHRLSIRE